MRVEVEDLTRKWTLTDVVDVLECGAIQNPANLRAQVEGCIIRGWETVLINDRIFHP